MCAHHWRQLLNVNISEWKKVLAKLTFTRRMPSVSKKCIYSSARWFQMDLVKRSCCYERWFYTCSKNNPTRFITSQPWSYWHICSRARQELAFKVLLCWWPFCLLESSSILLSSKRLFVMLIVLISKVLLLIRLV